MSEEVQEVVETSETTEESNQTTSDSFVDSMLNQIEDEGVKSAGFWKNLEGKGATEVGQYIKELQSFAGKKGDIPKSDATEEDWNNFYSKLGRPESVEGYNFTIGDEFTKLVDKEAIPEIENSVQSLKQQAFEMGATSDQAEGLVDWFLSEIADNVTNQKSKYDEVQKDLNSQLQKEWGDEYDGINKGIDALLLANGFLEDDLQMMRESGILNDPALAMTLGKIAAKFDDDPEIGHHQTKTMSGLKDQLAEVEMEVMEYIKTGEKIPKHIFNKRQELMNKLGDDL